jgi:hypothetical protein
MLFYSHIWDLLLKALSLVATIIVLVALHVQERLEGWGASSGIATLLVIVLAMTIWIPLYREGISTLATWLYARVSLGASVSFAEARQLARLFQLDVSLKWIPLKEVRKLPKPQRRDALFAALDGLAAQRKAMLI